MPGTAGPRHVGSPCTEDAKSWGTGRGHDDLDFKAGVRRVRLFVQVVVDETIVSAHEKFASFEVLVRNNGNGLGASSLVAAEELCLVARQGVDVHGQQKAVTRVGQQVVIAFDVSVCGLLEKRVQVSATKSKNTNLQSTHTKVTFLRTMVSSSQQHVACITQTYKVSQNYTELPPKDTASGVVEVELGGNDDCCW